MPNSDKQPEPSMEEILASIRKIVSEEPQTSQSVPEKSQTSTTPPRVDFADFLDEPTQKTALTSDAQPKTSPSQDASQSPTDSSWPFPPSLFNSDPLSSEQSSRSTDQKPEDKNPNFFKDTEQQINTTSDPTTFSKPTVASQEPDQKPLVTNLQNLESAPNQQFDNISTDHTYPSDKHRLHEITIPPESREQGQNDKKSDGNTVRNALIDNTTDSAGKTSAPHEFTQGKAPLQDVLVVGPLPHEKKPAERLFNPSTSSSQEKLNPVESFEPPTNRNLSAHSFPTKNVTSDENLKDTKQADQLSLKPASIVTSSFSEDQSNAAEEKLATSKVSSGHANDSTSSPTLEAAMSDLLRPIVHRWLEDNVPELIEAERDKNASKNDRDT